jgi:uncharacterized protein with PIN domain
MEPAPQTARFRFYAELNDHLPPDQQYKPVEKSFFVSGTVKDMLESFGVPHTEVDLILANSESVDFSYVVRNSDQISVYPTFESIDITDELRVRPKPLRSSRFVLDVHLGKLAAYLRMLGFDAVYRNSCSDHELVRISTHEHRILLTRDRGLLKHGAITHGYWMRQTGSRRQLEEVLRRFDLMRSIQPFTICMACNGPLNPVSTEQAVQSVPPRIAQLHSDFRQCSQCSRIYWKGSHYDRMQHWIQQLLLD